jgi:predicted P-loop ATPase
MKENKTTVAGLKQVEPQNEESMDQTMQNTSVGSTADVTPSEVAEADSDEASNVRIIKEFLEQNYEFRNNLLSGKLEFRQRDNPQSTFRPLTREAENSIILRACLELEEVKGVKANVQLIIHSEETPEYDLVREFLGNLPKWDGVNRVAELFGRLPGITSEQIMQCTVWFRSAVAHWLRLDLLHGNETVPTLIGDQGCGKTVFCRRLLPPHLQQYFLDHMNFSNKFDKDMALSNNLIVVLDELDQYKSGQQAQLKQALSKCTVNGRPIFGTAQQDRHRFASFLATTNNPHPLNDPTGSRRYICIRITEGALINNDLPIDYPQLYAQLMEEVCERKLPYWFSPDETRRIQEANVPFQRMVDIEEMVNVCFRRPEAGEPAREYSMKEIMSVITREYPLLQVTHGMKIRIGSALKQHGFEPRQHNSGVHYILVPKRVA